MHIGRNQLQRSLKVLALSSIITLLFIQSVWAGGGINYKVKVRDYCGYNMKIKLHYGVGGNQTKTENLSANGSVSFETGARCPYSLSGEDPYHVYAIYTICTNGGYHGCGVTCESSDWKIVKQDTIVNTSDGQVRCKFVKD